MNHKIKSLVEQSGLHIAPDNKDATDREVEFFAELIIKECASLFPLQFTDEPNQRRIDKTILKHFGLYD